MPEAESHRTKYPDGDFPLRAEQWFDDLDEDEQLLARVVWRIRGYEFPSREELDRYFEPRISGEIKPSLADLLTLGELWEMTVDWAPSIVLYMTTSRHLIPSKHTSLSLCC